MIRFRKHADARRREISENRSVDTRGHVRYFNRNLDQSLNDVCVAQTSLRSLGERARLTHRINVFQPPKTAENIDSSLLDSASAATTQFSRGATRCGGSEVNLLLNPIDLEIPRTMQFTSTPCQTAWSERKYFFRLDPSAHCRYVCFLSWSRDHARENARAAYSSVRASSRRRSAITNRRRGTTVDVTRLQTND